MTVSSVQGNNPVEDPKGQKQTEKSEEEQQPVSIYHKLDTEGTDGKKGSDGKITVKEFGIDKLLNKVEEKLNDLKSKATGVTFTVLNALFKIVAALRKTFSYEINEEGLKSVDTEAASRTKDAENIEDIAAKLKKNEAEGVEKFKKTQFGLLEKPENQDIDPEHNLKAKELTTKDENEKINEKHKKDLDDIFKKLVKLRKSVPKLIPQEIPLENGYSIRSIVETPLCVTGKTKGEKRTESGSHIHVPDVMQLTIEYEYKGADNKIEKGIYIAKTTDIPVDYAQRGKDDEKDIKITQEETQLPW